MREGGRTRRGAATKICAVGRGGPLIKFTAPRFKCVKAKTPFRAESQSQDAKRGLSGGEQIPPHEFDRWKQKFYTSIVGNSHDDHIVGRYKQYGLIINILKHTTC